MMSNRRIKPMPFLHPRIPRKDTFNSPSRQLILIKRKVMNNEDTSKHKEELDTMDLFRKQN